MKKKFNFKIFLIVFFTVLVFLYLILFTIKKNTKVEIIGNIKEVGVYYIVVNDSENNDYLLEISNSDFNVGDKVNIVLKNIKEENPITGEIVKIDTINKNVDFSIIDKPTKETIEQSNTNNEIINSNSNSNDNTNNNTNIITNDSNITTEEQVVTYFTNFSNEIDNSSEFKGTIKEKFVKVVDFLFYDEAIGNVTFDSLTNSTKLKILQIAMVIDEKIKKKFPNYKENISSTGSRIYTNVKAKVIESYLDITTKLCTNEEQLCNDAKNGLKDMKESFSLTWEFIKEITGVGIIKLKNWYEIWREV